MSDQHLVELQDVTITLNFQELAVLKMSLGASLHALGTELQATEDEQVKEDIKKSARVMANISEKVLQALAIQQMGMGEGVVRH